MSLLFETIRLHNRKLHNLAYHHERMQRSRLALLGITEVLNLEKNIALPIDIGDGLYRCRVSYQHEIEKIEFFPYEPRHPKRIELVEDAHIEYPHKFEDRSAFDSLLRHNTQADDVLILHDGQPTDTTFANVAFFDGQNWLTPDTPLLRGTKRAALLAAGVLTEARLVATDLKSFRQMALINAMRDLEIVYDYTYHDNHLTIHGTY